MRIAIGGFQHETNSFAPAATPFSAFLEPGGWPALARGDDLFDAVCGRALPIAGFISAAARAGAALVPLTWANAAPGGPVTDDAFERVAALIIADIAAQGPFDAIYLDLHGAMVTQSLEDGEGELLRRVRAVAGPDCQLIASLDLHANVTAQMAAQADLLTAYRSYPHVDMAETGARAARRLTAGQCGAVALAKTDYLIPITAQCSLADPARRLYAALAAIEAETGADLSFCMGFPPADIVDCGPAVIACAPDKPTAQRAAARLAALVATLEADFAREEILTPQDAIARAATLTGPGPVILADTQDNPGAGGPSDTTGVLRAMLAAGVTNAALALLHDPAAAAAAHAAGLGATLTLDLGGRSWPGDEPLSVTAEVLALGDGDFIGTGPMWGGGRAALGPMARLRVNGIDVLVASKRQQPSTLAMFEHLGLDPAQLDLLALKSSVHFRAVFQDLARAVLVVAAPGPNLADPRDFAYRRLRSGVRRFPHAGAAAAVSADRS